MVCAAPEDPSVEGGTEDVVLFEPDGSVRRLSLPEAFDGVADAALVSGAPLVLAYRATPEVFESGLGTFDAGGTWRSVEVTGALPAYQFVEESRHFRDPIGSRSC